MKILKPIHVYKYCFAKKSIKIQFCINIILSLHRLKRRSIKQVLLNIPDNKYLAFISHLKSRFADIQVKEKKSKTSILNEEGSNYEIMTLSEISLSEDWLSDEDKRWD
ncbi:MAG: hypothetical protein K9H64_14765 [Bacteroidales bacterium]|nr:hypothetical protein [Bacteroidales bacterium]MCF8457228.1 hypothetical protein [Bacteroidales bacterium]